MKREKPNQQRARTSPSESPGLLLMLDGNPTLQRLISTWPNAFLAGGANRKKQVAKWAELAGLREVEVENAWDSLFLNGFVNRDGTVDPFAAKYLASMAMGRLPASVRRAARDPNQQQGGKGE